jgi:single-stranded DNA-binding protein
MDPQEGGDRCVFKVVTETASRDGQGVKVFKQTYHKVIAEGKLGQICSQCLHRGTHVFIQGAITDTPYTDSTSMEKVIKCVVMKMLGKEILKSIERQQEEGTFDESSLTGNR